MSVQQTHGDNQQVWLDRSSNIFLLFLKSSALYPSPVRNVLFSLSSRSIASLRGPVRKVSAGSGGSRWRSSFHRRRQRVVEFAMVEQIRIVVKKWEFFHPQSCYEHAIALCRRHSPGAGRAGRGLLAREGKKWITNHDAKDSPCRKRKVKTGSGKRQARPGERLHFHFAYYLSESF